MKRSFIGLTPHQPTSKGIGLFIDTILGWDVQNGFTRILLLGGVGGFVDVKELPSEVFKLIEEAEGA